MIKKLMLSLCAVAVAGSAAVAQQGRTCATDEFHRAQIALHPQIAIDEARLNQEINAYLYGKIAPAPSSKWAKTAFDPADETKPWPADSTQYHVPVVIHLIYDNAGDAVGITDADIYGMMNRLNSYYNQTDPALTNIILPFKPHIGNPHVTFHLANKDPQGKPTHGIRREFSYTTNGGDESAKISQWPPNQYLNIYLINRIGRNPASGTILAYATFPTDYANNPYSQGVISRADQVTATGGNSYTLAHEIGHFLFLYHTWNNNGKGAEELPQYVAGAVPVCGDDEVDDTPPTYGHFYSGCSKLFDTACAVGYLKDYDSTTFSRITGSDGIIAANRQFDTIAVAYNDSFGSIGQSFTTGSGILPLLSITLRTYAGVNNGGSTSLSLYNASGTTLIANSTNTPNVAASVMMTYNFAGVMLAANTTYKFVINSVGGHRKFPLSAANANTYAGGTMFNGTGANNPVSGNDLYFVINQLRRIDYPDTTNTQNIMDYSSCNAQMFSKGQVARMRAAIRSDVGNRNNLIDTANLIRTGIMDATGAILPQPDIAPTALFTISRPFTCTSNTQGIVFSNRSYNDNITGADWTFDKGAANGSSTNLTNVSNTFSETGWVNTTLTVTDDDNQTDSYTRNDLVYVADPVGITGHIEDFNPGSLMVDRFPIFNYFGNPNYKWELYNNAGFYDKTCIRFRNYDIRDQFAVVSGQATNTATESPRGLYADFYTPAYDLSGFGGNCFLDFYSAGAFRTSKNSSQNDTLLISYSTNCGSSWSPLGRIARGDLANNGYVEEAFEPGWMGNWREQSIPINNLARTNQVYFRIRFMPGTDKAYERYGGLDFGTGNHFYLDRFAVTDAPLSVKNGVIVKLDLNIRPNPTSGAATVRLNGGDNSTADINVTDVTGKLVYHTSVVRSATATEVEIPASVLAVKGMYLVQVVTNGATETQKLIAY